MDYSDLIKKLLAKDTRAAARLITIVENDITAAEKIINSIYSKTGNAFIVGVTGAPGTGKSTFISTLSKMLVQEGKKVGIICVDPSSPLTGGALLGDRIRMKENFSLENVFIRSMANRGQLGGLARATEDVIKILDAYGSDIIIIETVGVGQSEVDIFKSAHTVLVLMVPGYGDEIQTIKAGIMEITDIFVVNKMDLSGADRTVAELIQSIELHMSYKYDENINEDFAKIKQWVPEIVKVNSISGENFDILLNLMRKHRDFLEKTGIIQHYLKTRIKNETLQILNHKLKKKVNELMDLNQEQIDNYINQVIEKVLNPYSMADLLIKMLGID
jgi:LAO/AO transport system kinase